MRAVEWVRADGRVERLQRTRAVPPEWRSLSRRLLHGLPDPLPNMPYTLWCDPQEPGHVYAGLKNGDMWFSADHGDSWTQLDVNLGQLNRTVLVLD